MNAAKPIFVFRRAGAHFQHGVLGVARSAGRMGVPVHAVRFGGREPATRSRYIRGVVDVAPGASEEQWLQEVLTAGRRLGRPLIVPVDDTASVFVADHQDALMEQFLLPRQPAGLVRRLASKRELSEVCRVADVPAPRVSLPASEAELRQMVGDYGYPVVLKRSDAWLPTRRPGAPSVQIARNLEDLLEGYAAMESPVRPQVMLQEFLPGDASTVWMFNGYFGEAGCLCAFTGRKLRQYRPRVGPTSLGICERNDEVVRLATRLMGHVGYRGIVDMGFRYDARDGTYKLLDVNPRIGGTFRLFVGEGGGDVLRTQYLDLTGHPVDPVATIEGRRWLAEPTDLASALQLLAERELGVREWGRSLRGVDELAWWARDDPAPFLAMCLRALAEAPRLLRSGSPAPEEGR